MGGRTSNASKQKYNEKAYDQVKIIVPKGRRDVLKAHAQQRGESLNAFITRAINNQIEQDQAAAPDL